MGLRRLGLDVGLPSDAGQVAGIEIFGLEEPAITKGFYGVKMTMGGKFQPYGINIQGLAAGPGAGNGVDIDSARGVNIQGSFSTVGPDVTFGPGASYVSLSGIGSSPRDWSYSYGSLKSYGDALTSIAVPAAVMGIPGSGQETGMAALKGTLSGNGSVRLTMDGKAPNQQNCFNPTYRQAFNLSIQLIAQDITTPAKSYLWTMPIARFSAWYGAGTARLTGGVPQSLSTGGINGQSVTVAADRTNGCLDLAFMPPVANADRWDVTALINFTRAH